MRSRSGPGGYPPRLGITSSNRSRSGSTGCQAAGPRVRWAWASSAAPSSASLPACSPSTTAIGTRCDEGRDPRVAEARTHAPLRGAARWSARDRRRPATVRSRRLGPEGLGDRSRPLARRPGVRAAAGAGSALEREPRRIGRAGRRDDAAPAGRPGRAAGRGFIRSRPRPGGRPRLRRRLHRGAGCRPARLLRTGADRVKRMLAAAVLFALTLSAPAFAGGTFDPTTEFEQHDWIPIHLGPLNLSITKAVAYLLIGTALTILLGILLTPARLALLPDRRQTIGEALYEIAQAPIAEQGLPSKAIGRWFPYVATLLLFIFVVNLIGFIPLPLTGETWHGVPTWGIYAATSSLSVTLALALLTFVFTHVEGIRWNGPTRYFKSWIPEAPKPLLALIVPLEVLGQFMRLISLSVRLFANMLAGHILILTFLGLIFIFQSWVLLFVLAPATLFYVFDVVIVVGIQAFIFAALSAIYIGSAIEPEH